MNFFLSLIILINIISFNSILIGTFIFLILIFINFLGINLSIVLLSFIGIVFLLVWVLLISGFTFLAASLGLVYIGAILVLFLYLLILINQEKNNSENYINILVLSIYTIIISLLENYFKSLSFFIYTPSVLQNIPGSAKYYFQQNLELEIFSSFLFTYNLSIFYNLAFYLIISSILILNLLKNLF